MQWTTGLNGSPEVNLDAVLASDGAVIFPEACDQSFVYNGDGTLQYVQLVVPATPGTNYVGATYRMTFGYISGKVSSVTRWVKQ